jgi:flagellar protein FlgJ
MTGAAPASPDATPAAGVDGLPAAAMPAPATTPPATVAPVVPQATAFVGPPTPVTTTTPPVTNAGASSAGPPAPAQPAEAAAPPPPAADFRPGTPTEFVHALWPHAERAGRELGIDPRAIVAQAALETGWGQRQIRDADGRSAFNLFGIKADGNWDGRRIGVTTLEYEAGLPAPVRAQFRGYGSLAEGVADYVRFLRGNARYGTALGADSGAGFAAGLQSAGYATDPRYAAKIRNILESPGLNAAIDALKTGDRLPMQAATTS